MSALFGRWWKAVVSKPRGMSSVEEFAASRTFSNYTIDNAWRDYFAPVVRELGFKGSGRHFRRIDGEFVQTVNLQGSQYGGKFAVNLGLQPLNIPDVVGREIDPKTIKEIDCVFRNRLTYEDCDTWWSYGDDSKSKQEAAVSAGELFREKALLHFEERIQFAEKIAPEEIGKTEPGLYVALALLREKQGQLDQAKQFAEMAMARGSSKSWKGYSAIKHLLS